jgi:hypothetical protein
MPKHKVGTREEWSAARKALLEREQELAGVDEELAKQRHERPRAGMCSHRRTASSTTRTRAPRPTASCSLPTTTNCSTRSRMDVTPTSRCAATTSTRSNEKHGVRHLPGRRHAVPQT